MNILYFYFIPGAILFLSGLFIYFFSSFRFRFPFGYRTELSMKNLDVWNFANQCLGKYLFISAIISATVGYGFYLSLQSKAAVIVLIMMSALMPVVSSHLTGRKTYDFYDDNGLRIK